MALRLCPPQRPMRELGGRASLSCRPALSAPSTTRKARVSPSQGSLHSRTPRKDLTCRQRSRSAAGAQPDSQTSAVTHTQADPGPGVALTTWAPHATHTSCSPAHLLSHIHKPKPGTGSHVPHSQPPRRQPVGPTLTGGADMPTSRLAWLGQEQGGLPGGVAVSACRHQKAWAPSSPAAAPQARGKRTRPRIVSPQRRFTLNHSSWVSAHFLEKAEVESRQMPDSAHSPADHGAAGVLADDLGSAARPLGAVQPPWSSGAGWGQGQNGKYSPALEE